MKARLAYPATFLVPIAAASALVGISTAAFGVGVLWLFIYGDDGWPKAAEYIVLSLASLGALAVFAGLLTASYRYGKQREPARITNQHALIGVIASLLIPTLIFIKQL